jgi:hypothetical protein
MHFAAFYRGPAAAQCPQFIRRCAGGCESTKSRISGSANRTKTRDRLQLPLGAIGLDRQTGYTGAA